MSTDKHTPGPWAVKPGRYGGPHEVRFAPKSYGVVASIPTPGFQNLPEAPTAPECEANANLIAAAPELLEALENLLLDLEGLAQFAEVDLTGFGSMWAGGVEAARAAIAKARGEVGR